MLQKTVSETVIENIFFSFLSEICYGKAYGFCNYPMIFLYIIDICFYDIEFKLKSDSFVYVYVTKLKSDSFVHVLILMHRVRGSLHIECSVL